MIGPGGKIIQQIQEDTGAIITIDEIDGVGKVQVSAANKDCIEAAMSKIKAIVAIPEVGEIYEGTVRSIMPYGCFVEIMPGKDGLLHISEIDWKRLETVEDAGIKEGDKIKVKLMEIDPKTGNTSSLTAYSFRNRKVMPSMSADRDRSAGSVAQDRDARTASAEHSAASSTSRQTATTDTNRNRSTTVLTTTAT